MRRKTPSGSEATGLLFLLVALAALACAPDEEQQVTCLATDEECIDGARLKGVKPALVDAEGRPITESNFAQRIIHTQDIWVYTGFRVADEPIDLMQNVLQLARDSLGLVMHLDGGFTFQESHSISGSVIDSAGRQLSHIRLTFGLLRHGNVNGLIGFSSANLERSFTNLGPSDFVMLDLSKLDSRLNRRSIELDFAFGQTLPPVDPSEEAELTDVQIFVRRWNAGDIRFLGQEKDGKSLLSIATSVPVHLSPGLGTQAATSIPNGSIWRKLSWNLVAPLHAQGSTFPQYQGKPINHDWWTAVEGASIAGAACAASRYPPLILACLLGGWVVGDNLQWKHEQQEILIKNEPLPKDECIAGPVPVPPPDGEDSSPDPAPSPPGGDPCFSPETCPCNLGAAGYWRQSKYGPLYQPCPPAGAPGNEGPPPEVAPQRQKPLGPPGDEGPPPEIAPQKQEPLGPLGAELRRSPPPLDFQRPGQGEKGQFSLAAWDLGRNDPGGLKMISGVSRDIRTEAINIPAGPSCGGGSGDPHLMTFDKLRYDLQAAGEFLLLTDGTGLSDIQIRMEPMGSRVAVTTALAMEVGESRVTITADNEPPIRINGEHVALRTALLEPLPSGGHISRFKNRVGVYWPDGTVLRVGLFGRYLDFNIYLPADRAGEVRGLLGDFDGRTANDFQTRDGELLRAPPEFDPLYQRFAESWRIAEEESLFDYTDGQGTATFTDRAFPAAPAGIEDLPSDVRQRAEEVCRKAGVTEPSVLESCIIDVGFTKDPSFALSALGAQRLHHAIDEASAGATSLELEGRPSEIRGGEVAIGAGLAFVRTSIGRSTRLHAIDLLTGEVRWTAADIHPHCRPVVVEGLGVAVQLKRRSTPEGNRVPIALLSLDDGKEMARSSGDIPGSGCSLALSASGSTVIQPGRRSLSAFDAANGMSPLWTVETEEILHQGVPEVDGHFIVFSWQPPASLEIRSLSPGTGAEVDRLAIAGGRTLHLSVLEDHSVAAIAGNAGSEAKAITIIEITDGKLTERWSRDFEQETELRLPQQLTLVDDVVVGWTKHDEGAGLVGFDARTGDVVWTHRATSFDNSRGMVESVGGSLVAITPFGGAWVEIVSSDGERWATLEPPVPEYRRAPAQLTMLSDGRFLATGIVENKDTAYVLFLEPER